jgi:serine/threonine protein kinase
LFARRKNNINKTIGGRRRDGIVIANASGDRNDRVDEKRKKSEGDDDRKTSSSSSLPNKRESSNSQQELEQNANNNRRNNNRNGPSNIFGFSALNDLALKAKDILAPDATSSAPPPVAKDSTMDPLEAILAWHLGSSTSTTLTSQEVSDTIVNEVTSFPANKLVRGQSPSVAMHLPIPFIRAHERKFRGRKELAMGRKAVMETEMMTSSGNGSSGVKDATTIIDIDDSNDPLLANLRVALESWQEWSAPTVALALRGALMSASALRAASGLSGKGRREGEAMTVLLPSEGLGRSDLKKCFDLLWPDAPFNFESYGSNMVDALNDEEDEEGVAPIVQMSQGTKEALSERKRGEKKMVVLVHFAAPGNDNASESDGEAMVKCAETLLEKNVPFVALTIWLDDSLAKAVQSGRPKKEEKENLKQRMEKRTRILLGRSVKRVEAKKKVDRAFALAKNDPTGRSLVALEESIREAQAVGAVAEDGEQMLRDVRLKALAMEEVSLANALKSQCVAVPMDEQRLVATLERARKILRQSLELEKEKAQLSKMIKERKRKQMLRNKRREARRADPFSSDDDDEDVEFSIDEEDEEMRASSSPSSSSSSSSSSSAASVTVDVSQSDDDEDDEDEDDDEDGRAKGKTVVSSFDADPFVSNDSSVERAKEQDGVMVKEGSPEREQLATAIKLAEFALEAIALESDMRKTLADEASRTYDSIPTLENLLLRATNLASSGLPLTQEGAAKLNALVSRIQSRTTALQEMEGVKAGLVEALELNLRGGDLASGGVAELDVMKLEEAIRRAKASAWPWKLEEEVVKATIVLGKWQSLRKVEDAIASRSKRNIKLAIEEAEAKFTAEEDKIDLRRAKIALEELEAEDALEGGDKRLKAYFMASKVAWQSGSVTPESAQMLATLRESLEITAAEHEQVQRMANASSSLGAEESNKKKAQDLATLNSMRQRTERVRFDAMAGVGVRGPVFESNSKDEAGSSGVFEAMTQEEEEAIRVWASAIPDDDGAGEAAGSSEFNDEKTNNNNSRSGADSSATTWRKVGDSIIYNEEEVIGVGSAGTYVFRGYVRHTSRARHAVAVKRIARPPGKKGRELVRLVEREVELMTALNQSPKVPFFHCWGITNSNVFIALELCPESLREHVSRQNATLGIDKRVGLLKGVASGIEWLHDASKPQGCITHNDLKPENLLVTANGEVKIADVGLGVKLSKESRNGSKHDQYSLSTFNKYGVSILLAGRAPEILQRKPLTPAADIWAMGVCFFFVLTGLSSPFGSDPNKQPSDEDIIAGKRNLQILMRTPGLSPRRQVESRHLLSAMLDPNPRVRPTAAEVCVHPLLWNNQQTMLRVRALHERGASLGNQSLTSVLDKLATSAMLHQGSSAGSSDRGALLMAVNMDSTDWQRRIDSKILERVLSHAANSSRKKMKSNVNGDHPHNKKPTNNIGSSATISSAATVQTEAIGVKPYGNNFADLLRFCRNAYEHPPNEKEMIAMIDALVEARNFGEAIDSLPDGLLEKTNLKRASRAERKALLAAYLMHLFPGLALAVHEVSLATEKMTISR